MLGVLFDDERYQGETIPTSDISQNAGYGPPPPRSGLCGIANQGATCYLNSLLQTLLLTPEFRDQLFSLSPEELEPTGTDDKGKKKSSRKLPVQIQLLFARMLLLDEQTVDTTALTASFGWESGQASEQHDVQELNRMLFSAIEKSLVGLTGSDLVKNVYGMKTIHKIMCEDSGHISEHEENNLDLNIAVVGFKSIEDYLAQNYADVEMLRDENMYQCDECGKLVNAIKSVNLSSLPPILTFCLLRFNMEMNKVKSELAFPFMLNLEKYVADEAKSPGMETNYELFSVIVHRGTMQSGHYFAFIRDIDNIGIWNEPSEDDLRMTLDRGGQEKNCSKLPEVVDCHGPVDSLAQILLRQPKQSASVDVLGQRFIKAAGVSWSRKYKKTYGQIAKFAAKHPDIFSYDSKTSTVSLLPNYKTPSATAPESGIRRESGDSASSAPSSRWFCCDDSRITAATEEDVKAQYSGAESGYMLFYRRANMERPEKSSSSDSFGMPPHLLEYVEELNAKLHKERAAYDEVMSSIELSVHILPDYQCLDDKTLIQKSHYADRRHQTSKKRSLFELKEELGAKGLFTFGMDMFFASPMMSNVLILESMLTRESASDELTLEELEVTSGMHLFVVHLDELDTAASNIPPGGGEYLRLSVIVDSETQEQVVSRDTKLHEVVAKCVSDNIDLNDLQVYKWVEPEMQPLDSLDKSLFELELDEKDKLVVSFKCDSGAEEGDTSASSSFFIKVKNLVENGKSSEKKKEVHMPVSNVMTAELLKSRLIERFGLSAQQETRLRLQQSGTESGGETLLYDHCTLEENGVKRGMSLVLEEGFSPAADEIVLKFSVNSSDSQTTYEVCVKKSAPITCVVQHMTVLAEIEDPSEAFIQTTNWSGDPDRILKFGKKTVDQCSLKNYDYVILKTGPVPEEGLVTVHLFLDVLEAEIRGADYLQWLLASLSLSLETPLPERYVPLGDLQVSRRLTLSDLKKRILLAMESSMVPEGPNGEDKELLLRVSMFNGYWSSTVLKRNKIELHRLKVVDGTMLAVKVLHTEEALQPTDMLLSVRQLRPGIPPLNCDREYGEEWELPWSTSQDNGGAKFPSLGEALWKAKDTTGERRVRFQENLPAYLDYGYIDKNPSFETVCTIGLARLDTKTLQWVPLGSYTPNCNSIGAISRSLRKGPAGIREGDLLGYVLISPDHSSYTLKPDLFDCSSTKMARQQLAELQEERHAIRAQGSARMTRAKSPERSKRGGVTIEVENYE